MFCAAIGRERGNSIWRVISAPYEKLKEDDCDFIVVAGDDEDEASISASSNSNSGTDNDENETTEKRVKEEEKELDPEELIVRELRRRRGVRSDSSSNDGDGNDGSQSEEEKGLDSDVNKDGSDEASSSVDDDGPEVYYSESEEDDWIKQKRTRPKKQSTLFTPPKMGRRLKNSSGKLIPLTETITTPTVASFKTLSKGLRSNRKSLSDSSSDDDDESDNLNRSDESSSDWVKQRGTPTKSPRRHLKKTTTTPLMNDLSVQDNDNGNRQTQTRRRIKSPRGKNITVSRSIDAVLGKLKTPSPKTKRIFVLEDSDDDE